VAYGGGDAEAATGVREGQVLAGKYRVDGSLRVERKCGNSLSVGCRFVFPEIPTWLHLRGNLTATTRTTATAEATVLAGRLRLMVPVSGGEEQRLPTWAKGRRAWVRDTGSRGLCVRHPLR
jgi:hypothetical protein